MSLSKCPNCGAVTTGNPCGNCGHAKVTCRRLDGVGTCSCVEPTDCENACEVEGCGQMGLVPGASIRCAGHYMTEQDERDLAERLGISVVEFQRSREGLPVAE